LPSTVGTSTSLYATWEHHQRKVFFANGRFWVFYSDGTNFVYRTSSDGSSWSSPTIIGPATSGGSASVFFDGTYVHYARRWPYNIYYRRGLPNCDGTITWSAAEQTVYSGDDSDDYRNPMIVVDSGGYAWIGVRHYDGTHWCPYVFKNANTDGTWSTATGFPYQLSTTDDPDWRVSIVPLTNLKVYVIYANYGSVPLGILYDGGWGAEENDLADYPIWGGRAHSAVNKDDDIFFVYLRSTSPQQIRYNFRDYDGTPNWTGDILVQEGETLPVLAINKAKNELYCFWSDKPTAEHIYYKKCVAGTWDTDPTDWIDESTDHLAEWGKLSCYYKDYDFKIGLVYMTKTSSPYNIRHEWLPALHPQHVMGMMHSGL